jgi:uncharacterized protein
MMMGKKECVLLTGASFGIGYEMAKLFARDRHEMVLVARSEEKLQVVAAELLELGAAEVHVLPVDLSHRDGPEKIAQAAAEKNLQIDILVNNAGFGDHGAFVRTAWKKEEAMIQVNITSLLHLTKLFLPGMIKRGHGRIVNLASTAAFQPGPFMSVYYATKAFVLSFSEALAEECKGSGVTVTAVCPGPTTSEFQVRANIQGTALISSGLLRFMDAERVARQGYRAMKQGRRVIVTGAMNRFGAWSGRHLPRPLIMAAIRRLHKKRNTEV